MELKNFTIKEIHNGLVKKEFSALELCRAYLERIDKEDRNISAFLTIAEDLALSQARKIDEMIFQGKEIPILAGVPCAIKDNILIEGIKCTAGSKILENYLAPYDATVVKKVKEQKAVILGKTNLDEFAMGSSTENSAFFPTKNPLDLTRVPGGSSGGSAAAVAGNLCLFALGSDTGGSIRLPASFCGVVGLKPTYGAVSRCGLIAFASSLDQIGPISKTVEDAKIVFDVIKGWDEMDSTSLKFEIRNSKAESRVSEARRGSLNFVHLTPFTSLGQMNAKHSATFEIRDLRIGLPREYFIKGIDPGVEKVIKEAIKKYEEMGAKFEEISLPHTEYALACYYIIAPSEASANLARYDAIRYGEIKNKKPSPAKQGEARDEAKLQRTSKIKNLFDYYLTARGEGFGPEVRRRIMLGTYALSAGYYQAYYLRAQKVRTLIRQDFDRAFKKVDLILTPVSPTPAFKLGEKVEDPLTMYLSDIYTVSINLAGLPALSLPIGNVTPHHFEDKPIKQDKTKKTKNNEVQNGRGLPVGLQIIGRPFEEEKILEIGKLYVSY